MDAARKREDFTLDDIYNLPDGQRAELMDGGGQGILDCGPNEFACHGLQL